MMKIESVKSIVFPEIKLVRFARFHDQRGYFTEHYRKTDFANHPEINFMTEKTFLQCNESYSKKGTIRGLHFQWNPYMGKLVRTISGHMIDMILDIRKESPSFGKIVCQDMPADDGDFGEWIWIPKGFAHGVAFLENTLIEYFCTSEYNPDCEAGISLLSDDIDWTICDQDLKKTITSLAVKIKYISNKDSDGFTLENWQRDSRSDYFIYGNM